MPQHDERGAQDRRSVAGATYHNPADAPQDDYGTGNKCPECGVDLAGQSPRKHARRHWDDPDQVLYAQDNPAAYERVKALYDMEPEHHRVPPSRIDQTRS